MKRFAIVLLAIFGGFASHASAQTAHTATWTITSSSVTSTATGTAQIWRVVVPNGTSCPTAGNSTYINVQSVLPPTSATTTGASWTYVDSGSTLTSGSIYCGYATVTFNSGGGPSAASAIFQGQIPTPVASAPSIAVTLK